MQKLNEQIENELLKHGANLVGFANLKDRPVEMTGGLPRAISIAVALEQAVVWEISNGPTKNYYAEYVRLNNLLEELCERAVKILTKFGAQAEAFKATTDQFDPVALSTRVQHKTIATRAGLGWIGKSALLITEKFGPAVRLESAPSGT